MGFSLETQLDAVSRLYDKLVTEAVPAERCDITGCGEPATATIDAGDWLRIGPRDSTGDHVSLCATHANAVVKRLDLELRRAAERRNPNLNPSNRAVASEHLGDAEE